jgi:hypothetical protein
MKGVVSGWLSMEEGDGAIYLAVSSPDVVIRATREPPFLTQLARPDLPTTEDMLFHSHR